MNEIETTGLFDDVLGMIYSAKQKAEYQVNSTIIELYWAIGEYVSKQVEINGWGKSTVKALPEYILSREPGIRGYSSQNIWRMKQFYETYKDRPELSTLLRENTKMPKNFLNWVYVCRRCLNSWTLLGGMELFMKRLRGFRCGV